VHRNQGRSGAIQGFAGCEHRLAPVWSSGDAAHLVTASIGGQRQRRERTLDVGPLRLQPRRQPEYRW
jgi:hypothetical protein